MKTEKFESILNERINKCVKVLCAKADEYATEDRLHNFKVAAELQNCTPITALAGMMAKHNVGRENRRPFELPILAYSTYRGKE